MLKDFPKLYQVPWSCSDPSKQFAVHNPATGEIITTVQAGDVTTTENAIAAAHAAFPSWSAKSSAERSAILMKCSEELSKHKTELAEILCMENGKPYHDALMFDINFVVSIFAYFAALIDKLPTQFYDRGSVYVSVVREPRGVGAGILPFNWPPIHCGGKIAPALATGNTMIIKPGEQAPLTAMRIVEILQSVLPTDVLHLVPGVGTEVPQTLIKSPTVKMVSFTGSTPAGIAVSKTASDTMTALALELGGKNAFIVFEDANLDRAVKDALEGAFFNKGEACTAASRLLIHNSIYHEFVSRLAKAVNKLRAGNGMDEKTHVGPCVTQAQRERVLKYLEKGKEQGAVVAGEGSISDDPALKNGYFIKPTLLKNVTRDMVVAKEEIFGPVVTATSFSTEDEAVSIANEVEFGLTSIIFTQDSERGLRVARRIEAGMIFLNNYRRNVLGLPFGGVKSSGQGREHWIGTLDEWTDPKFIQMPSGRGELMFWRGVKDCFDD